MVSRTESMKLLSKADTQAGTFLIRDSVRKRGQHYSLSLYDGITIKHYHISNEFNKYYISHNLKFDSLNHLVRHYMVTADRFGLTCPLTVSIPKLVSRPIAVNKKWKINKLSIKFLKCINAGHFGETWKGIWKGNEPVRIKTNIATDITQEKFIEEANILAKLNGHQNIISPYGICTEDYPFYIVTEPMNKSLKDHLTTNNPTPAELVGIAIQVTDGMIYLGEQDYIHCDLRAANILLGDHNTIKIANFHLAQHLKGSKYWIVERGTELAIRWTAPEGFTLKRLSIKSDVWSFGILLWELVTKGDLPYHGMNDDQVHELLLKGKCTYIPRGCPKPFNQLMMNCWKHKDYERPSFKDIFDLLITYNT